MDPDLILLNQYEASGDAEAFAELVNRHTPLVYSTALRVTGDAHEAEDVAQNVFLELARKAADIESSVAGWLHSIALSRSLDVVRAGAIRRRHEEQAARSETAPSEPTWQEIEPYVDKALAELPDDLRVPLVLHYLEGQTQGEIAKGMGISQSAISRRLEKGVEELREKLSKAGFIASVVLVSTLLSGNAIAAVPETLKHSLGKMAMSGIRGRNGSAAAEAASNAKESASQGAGLMSSNAAVGAALIVAVFLLVGLVVFLLQGKPAGTVQATPAQQASTPKSVGEQVSPPPEVAPKGPLPEPVSFSLATQSDGMETQQWVKSDWGNPVTFETIDVEGRGKVLKVVCGHNNIRGTVFALNEQLNLKERPFFVVDVLNKFDHGILVGVGAVTDAYYEGSFLPLYLKEDYVRITYDTSERLFKTAATDWLQGLLLPDSENVRELRIAAYSQKEKDRSGVLFLDNLKFVKGVFVAASFGLPPFPDLEPPDSLQGDFNNDGLLDRLLLRPAMELQRGQPDGAFSRAEASSGIGTSAHSAAFTDINRDGFLDLAILRSSTGPLEIWLGDGTGSFTNATSDWMFPPDDFGFRIKHFLAFDAVPDGDEDFHFLLEDGSWVSWRYDSPRGPQPMAPVIAILEMPSPRPVELTLSDAEGTCFGARILDPPGPNEPNSALRTTWFVPPGNYTVSAKWGESKPVARSVPVEDTGQQIAVTASDLFPLWPKHPVRIDGHMTPGEWEPAAQIEKTLQYEEVKTRQPETHRMTVRYCADSYGLYICVTIQGEDSGTIQNFDALYVYFDNDADTLIEPGEDCRALSAHLYSDRHFPFPGMSPVPKHDTRVDGNGAIGHSTRSEIGDYTYEFMIPWNSRDPEDIRVAGDVTLGIKLVYSEARRYELPYEAHGWTSGEKSFDGFPDGDSRNGKTYADLIVRGLSRKPGEPPGPVSVEIRERKPSEEGVTRNEQPRRGP